MSCTPYFKTVTIRIFNSCKQHSLSVRLINRTFVRYLDDVVFSIITNSVVNYNDIHATHKAGMRIAKLFRMQETSS